MSFIQSLILGFIQGLTEFLPVSSSGHLALFQKLFHLDGSNLFFDLVLHTGTLLSLILFFFKDLLLIADLRKKQNWVLIGYVILATLFTGAIGLVIEKHYDALSSLYLLSIFFLITAITLLLTKNLKAKDEPLNAKKSIFIGIAQGIAALPGVSRSGSTIAAGLFVGLNRQKAFFYSFILSIPAILGADFLEIVPVIKGSVSVTGLSFGVLLGGFLTSFIVGFFALKILSKLVISNKFYYFGYYCLFIACVTLIIGIVG